MISKTLKYETRSVINLYFKVVYDGVLNILLYVKKICLEFTKVSSSHFPFS